MEIRIEGELTETEGVRLCGRLMAELQALRLPQEIRIDGVVRGKQMLICSRTLEEFEHPFKVPLHVRIVLDSRANACELSDGDEEEYLLRANPTVSMVDLSECIRQQILLNEPFTPLKNPEEEFRWSSEEGAEEEEKSSPWGELEKLKKSMRSTSSHDGKQENPDART